MEKNILLFGMKYDTNLGDAVIAKCTLYLVRRALKELELNDVSITEVDMTGRKPKNSNVILNKEKNVPSRQIKTLKNILKRLPLYSIAWMIRSYITEKRAINKIRMRAKCVCNDSISNNTKCIIFAGGGLIKYKTQELWAIVDIVTKYADDNNIPVMFNATGVEGFDKHNKKCKILKKALNRNCVKVITTRDDLHTLRSNYIHNNCITEHVADPACWSSIVWNEKKEASSNVIGLGIGRYGLFSDNGVEFNKHEQITFWHDVIRQLNQAHIEWKLFCNGLEADYDFLLEIAEILNITKENILERPRSADEIVDQITKFKGIIAYRLHAAIIAYSFGIPCVEPIWNDKQRIFGESINRAFCFVDCSDINGSMILDKLKQAEEINFDVKKFNDSRERTYEFIKNFIKIYG